MPSLAESITFINTLIRQGDYTSALAHCKEALNSTPDNYRLLILGAQLRSALGETTDAITLLENASQANPAGWEAYSLLGTTYLGLGNLADAITNYKKACTIAQCDPITLYNYALASQQLGDNNVAGEMYRKCLNIQPNFYQAHNNLGNILLSANSLQDAMRHYEAALELNPALVEAHYNCGLISLRLDKPKEAEAYLSRLLRLAPEHDDARLIIGPIYNKFGKKAEWIDNFSKVRPLYNNVGYLLYGLGVSFYTGDFNGTNEYLERIIEHDYQEPDIHALASVLGIIQYFDVEQTSISRLYHAYNRLAKAYTHNLRLTDQPHATGKLRIGYLSPDYNRHVMGKLIIDIFYHHDRQRHEIFAYSLGNKRDDLTPYFSQHCDSFIELNQDDPLRAAETIANDRLDILVDLAAHMDGSQALILAYKPAPLIITHLGYHGAVGLDTVDFKLTDQYADIADNNNYLIEELLPMNGCVMPFFHHNDHPSPVTRDQMGIAEGAVVFGEFVNLNKLSPRCLATWKAVLDRVPNSLLAFSPFRTWETEGYINRCRAAGIEKSRIIFIPASMDYKSGRARYHLVDIVLDTFPYTGGDTTMAALDMGLPVVTLCGTRQSERMTYSILKHLGFEEGIAYSEAQYVDIACSMASRLADKKNLAASIKQRLEASGLDDMARYTRNLEEAYGRALSKRSHPDAS